MLNNPKTDSVLARVSDGARTRDIWNHKRIQTFVIHYFPSAKPRISRSDALTRFCTRLHLFASVNRSYGKRTEKIRR